MATVGATVTNSQRREDYLFLYRSVLEIISSLYNMRDPSQIDGAVLRLDCIKRYLVNIGDNSETDAIITQLAQIITGLQEERYQYENGEDNLTAARIIRQGRGRPSFDISEETSFFWKMVSKFLSLLNC